MSKSISTETTEAHNESTATATDATTQNNTSAASFWLLKDGTASKLGARAEGDIRYQVLANSERQHLYITITGNSGGGYFSRELVPLDKISTCLDAVQPGKPFPSKTFKDTFVGRSSNNAGFLAAILRSEGQLEAAPEAETQHVMVCDLDAWKSKLLTEPGILIVFPANGNTKTTPDAGPAPDKTKTLSMPRKKTE